MGSKRIRGQSEDGAPAEASSKKMKLSTSAASTVSGKEESEKVRPTGLSAPLVPYDVCSVYE